ncbi:uncharacterized protein LOC125369518 [Ricinus communis]|uniref:uncharacterized protein LOC125369518 n=1 Tax=Ricinus communis TaxID=3988 RepID=UPI00201A2A0E|nr:uncharacterized protein LOC125369518 [Ricinus communis]
MVSGIIPVCYSKARVLLDPRATHSFVSPNFVLRLDVQLVRLQVPISVTTPLSDALKIDVVFPSCSVLVEGQDLVANLIMLDIMDFDVILGMDWDTSAERGSVEDVQVVYEFPDVFLEELQDIEFCIDHVLGKTPISLPPYRMVSDGLKKLKE